MCEGLELGISFLCRYLSYNAYPFPYSSTTDIFIIYILYIIVNTS
jgi:hypothetical protein